jgi:serralysin
MKSLVLIFVSTVLLLSCQNSSMEATLPALPDGVTEVNGDDWNRIMTDDGYVLNSNPWNKTAAAKPYAQKIFKGVSNGTSFFGWQWFWNNTNDYTVLAYPQVFCGWSPFGPMGTIGHMPGYPYTIGGHSFHSTFDITMETHPVMGQEVWDLTFDLWILDSSCNPANFGRRDIKCEIMVWLDSKNSLLPRWLGSPNDTMTANGYTFDYYFYEHQADGNGPDGTHLYAAFSSQTPIHSSNDFDLTPFMTYLVNHGILTANDYVTTIELGTEVIIGSGQTIVRNYSVTVN